MTTATHHPILKLDELTLKTKQFVEVREAAFFALVVTQERTIRSDAKGIRIAPFHFQFLIEVVDEIAVNTSREVILLNWRSLVHGKY